MGSFIIGLLIIIAGAASVKYNRQVADSFGDSGLANMMGPGNKYSAFKLYSVVAIIIGLVIMFNLHSSFVQLVMSPFLNTGVQ